jgi:hypothetical protein
VERTNQGRVMKSEVIRIRINSELLEIIRKQAEANERTIAKQIQFTLKNITQQGGDNK